MNKNERCLEIVNILQKEHAVDVKDLAEQFHTSEMTIRRDLKLLSAQYNIIRTHGGAILKEDQPMVRIISFDETRIEHKTEKEKIASAAAKLINPRQRIFVDAGSTVRILLDYIPEDLRAVVVCNNLKVAEQAMSYKDLSVIMLGGDMIPITNCSSGPVAEEQIRKYPLDIAFIGATAIGTDGKLYDGYSPEARVKSALFEVAKKVYVMADSSKLNIYDMNEFGKLSQVAGVITDAGIDKEGEKLLKRHNVNVIIAE